MAMPNCRPTAWARSAVPGPLAWSASQYRHSRPRVVSLVCTGMNHARGVRRGAPSAARSCQSAGSSGCTARSGQAWKSLAESTQA